MRREKGNPGGLYKPWAGPDFSRWLEYLLTSPLQIFIVAGAFGFANADTVAGLCGMQGALVLLGYDIEQQVKKVYKLRSDGANKSWNDEHRGPRRFHHVLANFKVRDMRLWVYLLFCWGLHYMIWSAIIGRMWLQEGHAKACGAAATAPEIPDIVRWIAYIQGGLFTLFGLVSTGQAIEAVLKSGTDRDTKPLWYWVSNAYGVLSLTAKTTLVVMFIYYVRMYETWPEVTACPGSFGTMVTPAGRTCWGIG